MKMQDYSGEKYKDLYEHILIDYNFRFGKFSPINYPNLSNCKELKRGGRIKCYNNEEG